MNKAPTTALALALMSAVAVAGPARAAPGDAAAARAVLMKGVGFATVKGRGLVPGYAEYLKSVLVAGGFAPADVTIDKVGETANFHAVWKGSGGRAPIALAGHMDVVEADPKDWDRDPFTAIEDKGFLFGRGIGDNKFDVSMMISALVALRAEGFKPARDIHLFLSGDEETDGTTAAIQAKAANAAGVELLLNGDGGGGAIGGDGKAQGYGVSAAEKTYADYAMTVTDAGGHSSRPTAGNAIAKLASATARIAAHHFKPELNEITRASLVAEGSKTGGPLGAAMQAFAADPADAGAIATLRADPGTIGQIETTCVPTQVTGGHAPNALPQKAVLTVNCRIMPGTSVAAVRTVLETIVADPAVKVTTLLEWPSTPASPLRPDLMSAIAKAVAASHPGAGIVPSMETGASDSVFYRALGIPSYGVSGLFMRGEDIFIHGLNERIPVAAIAPALAHWRVLLTSLSK